MSLHHIPAPADLANPLDDLEDELLPPEEEIHPMDRKPTASPTPVKFVAPVVPAISDGMSLDDLLAESMELVSSKAEVTEARKALAAGLIPKEQVAEIKARIRVYELKREWIAEAEVVLFNVQNCTNCGEANYHFAGYFQRQVHRTSQIDRWVANVEAEHFPSGLPKETKLEEVDVEMCIHCTTYPIEFAEVEPEEEEK